MIFRSSDGVQLNTGDKLVGSNLSVGAGYSVTVEFWIYGDFVNHADPVLRILVRI